MRSKKALYNVGTNLLLQLITIIYGFIVPKIIISNFGSNVNGLVSSITQFLSYIALLESGFGPVVKSALYKPIASKNSKEIANIIRTAEKFFRKISYIFLAYIFILSILYPLLVNNDFSYLYTISLIVIIALSTFAEYFFGMTYRLFLQANQKTYIISTIQIVTYLANIILIVILAKLGAGIHIIKLVSSIAFVLRPIIQNIYVKKKFNINVKEANSNYKLKNKWDGLAQHIAAVIHNNTDITILTIFSTLAEVSVYSVYSLITRGLKSVVQAFNSGMDATFGDMIAKNENENLNKAFKSYEFVYFTIITIIFTCAGILTIPFIKIYTINITDADYIRPTFAYLIVLAEFANMIRLPYISLTYSAGHFKETRKGAWIEAILNIAISIILVNRFGIIGVAIGTLVAMIIRTVEFIYHSAKYILKRNIINSYIKAIVSIFETLLIVFACQHFIKFEIMSYFTWFIYGILIFAIVSIIIILVHLILYKDDAKNVVNKLKTIIKR